MKQKIINHQKLLGVTILIIFSFFCAHKGPPIRVDRINPTLKKIQPINEHQITLYFSEELDTLNIKPENILITAESETLKILDVAAGISPDQIVLTTEKMVSKNYDITGHLADKSGRIGFFKNQFIGSSKPDTIAPWLKSYSKGYSCKFFNFIFSEVMDTTSLKYYVFPKRTLVNRWSNLKNLYLEPASLSDSLNYDTTYYLYISEIKDFAGNRGGPFITSITPDTVYNPLSIRGKAMLNDTVINMGIALIQRNLIIGISTLKQGEFFFEVRDSLKYFVHIFVPHFSGSDSVSAGGENIIKLTPGEFNIDSLIN